jgi:hypothetical protein
MGLGVMTRSIVPWVLMLAASACADDRAIPLGPNVRPDRAVVGDAGQGLDARASGEDAADDARTTMDDDARAPDEDARVPGDDARVREDAQAGAPDAQPGLDAGPTDAVAQDAGVRGVDLRARWASLPPRLAPGGSAQVTVELTNLGTDTAPPAELRIDLRPAGTPAAQASVLAQPGVRSLAGGATEPVVLTLVVPTSVTPGSYVLRVVVDPADFVAERDETNNEAEAMIAALGLEIVPSSVALGPTATGCLSPPTALTLTNVGALPALIDSASVVGSPEVSLTGLLLPRTLAPGGSVPFNVQYAPGDVGVDQPTLELGFDQGGRARLVVPVTATGVAPPMRTDTFQQAANAATLDVLMLVDNSGSMSDKQAALSQQVPAFLQWAQAQGVDFHIGIVTTDMDSASESGRLQGVPTVLTPNTTNLAQVFASRILVGTNGSGDERGIDAILSALQAPLVNTTNAGFLRAGAALGVLVLSDEEDYSAVAINDAIAQLRAVKPNIRVNAIVTPGGGCPAGVSDGARYLALTQAFGGTAESICAASWTSALTSWGAITGPRSRFTLSRPARPQGMVVRVNGTPIPTASWSFEAMTNTVVFTPMAVPPLGATVEIGYSEGC